jgi:hypothetical protein
MANIFMMNEEIARGMVCFFHQKKHSYLICFSGTRITKLKILQISFENFIGLKIHN